MSAQTTSIAGAGSANPGRQALAYVTFAVVYYVLAAYALSLPVHTRFPLVIWPAHGLALGVLLVAPARRWPWYLLLAGLATAAVGFDMYHDKQMEVTRVLASIVVNMAQ
ncbi:MAG TPA: hypothetical protein VLJ84_12620, partial [Usitatibacter sp.]|nr:hypothetical protein [Usitatibacter sp.]